MIPKRAGIRSKKTILQSNYPSIKIFLKKKEKNKWVKVTGTQSRLLYEVKGKVLVAQSGLSICYPIDCSPPGSFCLWNSPGKNTEVGCHSLLLAQGSNLGLPHCRQTLYQLSHQGSPHIASNLQFVLELIIW